MILHITRGMWRQYFQAWHGTEIPGDSIYTELAEQYRMMDAASNVVKRNVLAQHLREVIDVLEQRVRVV
jgi:Centrosome microtubule-binding domain of Cep57